MFSVSTSGSIAGGFGDELRKKSLEKGFVLCGWTDLGFRCMTNNKHPINSAKDLASLKMRVPNSKAYIAMMQATGASTVAVDLSELYLALRQGVADGQDTPPSVVKSNKYYEVQKFVSKTDHILTVAYTVAATTGPAPTGTVTVTISGGSETCTDTVAAGQCTLTLTTVGTNRTVTATYSGDSVSASSFGTKLHTVDACQAAPVVTSGADAGAGGIHPARQRVFEHCRVQLPGFAVHVAEGTREVRREQRRAERGHGGEHFVHVAVFAAAQGALVQPCGGDEVGTILSLQQPVLGFEMLSFLQRAIELDLSANNRNQAFIVPRLLDEVAGAASHRFHCELHVGPRSHHDDRKIAVDGDDLGE